MTVESTDLEHLTQRVLAADQRERWLQSLIPLPALACLFLARNKSDELFMPFVACVVGALVLLAFYIGASRARRTATARLGAATLALAAADAPRPATPTEVSEAARVFKGRATGAEASRLRGVYRVFGGAATVGGVRVILPALRWHALLGIGEIVDVDVIPSVFENPRDDAWRVVVSAFGGRLSVERPDALPASRDALRSGYGPIALADAAATPADAAIAARANEFATPELPGGRRLWIGLAAAVGVAFAAFVGVSVVRDERAARRVRDAVAADSLAERRADSVIAHAVRDQTPLDSLRAALTPAAYAHDTAFATSVLAEERALATPACDSVRAAQNEADVRGMIARAIGQNTYDPSASSAVGGSPVAACVESAVRRERPLVTAADTARDSVRLAVRERFRRGARSMRDGSAGDDSGRDAKVPGDFDAYRRDYQMPERTTTPGP